MNNLKKEMTEEEIQKEREENLLFFKEYALKQEQRAKKIKTINEPKFRESLDILFDSCLSYLHGEYELYTVYEDSNVTPANVYALVYAEYYEKDFTSEENFLEVLKQDGTYLAKKLKESGHPLHYYFIMPYYNTLKKDSILYNDHIVVTNTLEIE